MSRTRGIPTTTQSFVLTRPHRTLLRLISSRRPPRDRIQARRQAALAFLEAWGYVRETPSGLVPTDLGIAALVAHPTNPRLRRRQ